MADLVLWPKNPVGANGHSQEILAVVHLQDFLFLKNLGLCVGVNGLLCVWGVFVSVLDVNALINDTAAARQDQALPFKDAGYYEANGERELVERVRGRETHLNFRFLAGLDDGLRALDIDVEEEGPREGSGTPNESTINVKWGGKESIKTCHQAQEEARQHGRQYGHP